MSAYPGGPTWSANWSPYQWDDEAHVLYALCALNAFDASRWPDTVRKTGAVDLYFEAGQARTRYGDLSLEIRIRIGRVGHGVELAWGRIRPENVRERGELAGAAFMRGVEMDADVPCGRLTQALDEFCAGLAEQFEAPPWVAVGDPLPARKRRDLDI